MKSNLPIGMRLNNPFNLKLQKPRIKWQGRVEDFALTQTVFDEFVNITKGVRAGTIDLITKYDRGLNTVRKIIEVFAPDSENDTEAYIKAVCLSLSKRLSFTVRDDTILNLHDYDTVLAFDKAIVRHEQGKGPMPGGEWIADGVYVEALRQAGITRTTKQVVTQSKTIRATSFAGAGVSVLGTTAVLDAAQEAKSALEPGTYVYAAITIIVLICCAYVVYDRVRKAKVESQ